jgi:hypothetical protein
MNFKKRKKVSRKYIKDNKHLWLQDGSLVKVSSVHNYKINLCAAKKKGDKLFFSLFLTHFIIVKINANKILSETSEKIYKL